MEVEHADIHTCTLGVAPMPTPLFVASDRPIPVPNPQMSTVDALRRGCPLAADLIDPTTTNRAPFPSFQ